MTGLRTFLTAFARRDRWFVLWFVLGVTMIYWSQAPSVDGLYTTRAAFEEAATMMGSNPAFIAMAGPARALDTTGGQVAWQASAFGAVVVGLMSMFLIGRHTRAEEESGRDELIRAGAVAHQAPMTAAVVTMVAANLLVATGVSLSLIGYGLAAPGALALGVGLAACGVSFGSVALLACQLTTSTRAAYALAGAVIGASYALRAVGDVAESSLSWLSPIGWYQGMHAYSGERWWPLLLHLAFIVLTLLAAYVAFGRRDFAVGLWAARPGPEGAGPGLRGALGLSWRLQRGAVVGWSAGTLLTGAAYGSIGNDIKALLGGSDVANEVLLAGAADLVDGFYASAGLMLALVASGFTISSALRPRTEEEEGRLEALFSTGLSRRRWWGAQWLVTFGGSVLSVGTGGLGMGLGFGLTTGDWNRFGDLVLTTLVMLPGVLVLGAITLLLVGAVPRAAALGWLSLVFCTVVLIFGEVLRFPAWVTRLSPFSHLGRFPVEAVPWGAAAVVLLLALVVGVVALVAFNRRDLLCR